MSLLTRLAWLACLALSSIPARTALREQPLEWTLDGQPFSGVLVYDDSTDDPRPGLVMVPNWMGVGEAAVAMARRIAGTDYVVLVADVYGRDVRPADAAEARQAVVAAYADGGRTLRLRANRAVDVLAGLDGVPVQPGRIGAVGFCFGGGVVLELARSGRELSGGVVSFHGNLQGYQPADGPIRTPVLVLHGADDSSVPPEHVEAFTREMREGGADWQLVSFGGARHCFSQPENADGPPDSNCRYDERTARRAFAMMRGFFRERFGP
ncbi:dienelactone hydrolase [Luteimonas sp. J16]|jgi:dienelactone hydrolase|uniref:dienelactone hydrolase family protein n=1 Tax=unclassified Luteimonas TaxID=2629088 RepID=UPI0004ACDBFA|nr:MULTISPECIES: dienelactone hydrolase family protein [unclassified Luteimonas]TWG90431.1 dienelactone hydrolase [Luteimonas sp. J16]TWG94286.1 dienelactone hydrolase [Luteimonas sp. J16]